MPLAYTYKRTDNSCSHHKNKEVNNFYVEYLAQVPGSEILQIGYLDWAVHLSIVGLSIYVGNLATWHDMITSGYAFLSKMGLL
jgi:hypothetical protein